METGKELTYNFFKYTKLFTPGIQKRIDTGLQSPLGEEDKSNCIALESMGPTAYQFLRSSGVPFPNRSTLRANASMFNLQPGFVEPDLSVLKGFADNDLAAYVAIYFDEVKLRRCYEFDKSLNAVARPADQALVVMVKGL